MTPETFINLIEEMVDIKIQQHAEIDIKTTPEVARVLQHKRETDRKRLAQIKTELTQLLSR